MEEKTREDLINFMEKSLKSQRQIAKETGLSTSVISQFLKGKYMGDNNEIAQTLNKYLAVAWERLNSTNAVTFYEDLYNTQEVFFAVNYAHIESDIVLVCGDSGAGKTTALKHYADTHVEVIFVTANICTDTPTAILSLICGKVTKQVPKRRNELMELLVSKLSNSAKLIIIDEADHLSFKALQAVRNLNDLAQVGIVLSGNDKIYRQMLTSRKGYEYDQLRTRLIVRKRVTNEYTPEEIAVIFPNLDDESIIYMNHLANTESLRGAKKLYEIALKSARISNKSISSDILVNTQTQMQGGF